MSWIRIKSIIMHTWYYHKHSLEAWIDLFWWSIISVFVFGFISLYFAGGASSQRAQIIIIGMILWEIVRLAQFSISISVLRDVWSRNLSNLFTTPLSTSEFLVAQMLIGVIKTVTIFVIIAMIALKVYNFSIFQLGPWLIFGFLNLLLFSWSLGIFILGLIFRYGTKIQAFAWSLSFLFQPITAVFYPLHILPVPIQQIALLIPITYIFEDARNRILLGYSQVGYTAIVILQNILYFIFAWWFFQRMFIKSKQKGQFARLEG